MSEERKKLLLFYHYLKQYEDIGLIITGLDLKEEFKFQYVEVIESDMKLTIDDLTFILATLYRLDKIQMKDVQAIINLVMHTQEVGFDNVMKEFEAFRKEKEA